MLKWAVHNARPSYLAVEQSDYQAASDGGMTTALCHVERRNAKLRRKSSTLCWRHAEKENLGQAAAQLTLTSTPLPGARVAAVNLSRHAESPLGLSLKKVQSLKDLSNILPESIAMTTTTTTTTTTLPQTPPQALSQRMPAHYASTLPTFEAEYSPCGLIPGPLLALRGMGIPDSYFEKPRYLAERLEQQANASMTSVLEEKPLKVTFDRDTAPKHSTANPAAVSATTGTAHAEQSTLSSTKMGDVTLERMIDAILASTRKETTRRHRRHAHGHAHAAARRRPLRTMRMAHDPVTASASAAATVASPSPTYRPAFDPASDLSEYWRIDGGAGMATSSAFAPLPTCGYQEREVRGSPTLGPSLNEHQQQLLRRQRAVRRKRQIAVKFSTSVRQSAQKLLAAGRERVSGKVKQQQLQQQHQRHVSPDSGHNSTSDFEEDEQLAVAQGQVAQQQSGLDAEALELDIWSAHQLDATKRRLSFSTQHLNI